MHPPGVVGFHLESVDKRLGIAIFRQVAREAFVAILRHHIHHILGSAQSRGSFDIGDHLGVESVIRHPPHLGSLHGVPEADALLVITPGLCVVR